MYIAQQCCIPLDKRNTGGGMREGGMRKKEWSKHGDQKERGDGRRTIEG